MMTIHGKICLITGDNNGIGKDTAQALAGMGAMVILVGRDARETSAEIEPSTAWRQ